MLKALVIIEWVVDWEFNTELYTTINQTRRIPFLMILLQVVSANLLLGKLLLSIKKLPHVPTWLWFPMRYLLAYYNIPRWTPSNSFVYAPQVF
jgi:hypothetical protein